MKQLIRRTTTSYGVLIAVFVCIIAFAVFVIASRVNAQTEGRDSGSLITIHDRGVEQATISTAKTIGEALGEAGIELNDQDIVEPAADQEIIAEQYSVNIYRARPITVIDGDIKRSVFSPYQTPDQIADSVGIELYPEDDATLSRSENIIADGAGLELTIDRATPINFMLHGKQTVVRTQAETVADMLREKDITLSADDKLSVDGSTPIVANMSLRLWREGKQTITVEEAVAFPVSQIQDANQPIGYKQIQTPGQNGSETVTYEILIQDGQEVSRTKIAGIVTVQPVQQVEIVGAKLPPATSPAENRILGRQMMLSFGFGDDQWVCLESLWTKESNWRTTAGNPTSGAYGIPQSLPASKMATYGADYMSNPVTQITWGLNYIKGRYQTPCGAWNHFLAKNWY